MPEQTITCPKCGLSQPAGAECRRCGVIFARIRAAAPGPATPARPGGSFRTLRIAVLLLVMLGLGLNLWLVKRRVAAWDRSLWVAIHPICGDARPETRAYVDALSPEAFEPLAHFFSAEAGRYGLHIEAPFRLALAPRLDRLPPPRPPEPSLLSMIVWSLRLRLWAWRVGKPASAPAQDMQLFVIYFDKSRSVVEHSYGLPKGYISVVNAYASPAMADKNNIVIAHELLHLAGAVDKYYPESELPVYPAGFADPEADPLYPQTQAEIMAGSIPLSESKAEMPEGLDEIVIGPATAREINWLPGT